MASKSSPRPVRQLFKPIIDQVKDIIVIAALREGQDGKIGDTVPRNARDFTKLFRLGRQCAASCLAMPRLEGLNLASAWQKNAGLGEASKKDA
jgi:hypothetical protein